jgi:hypothetical protein
MFHPTAQRHPNAQTTRVGGPGKVRAAGTRKPTLDADSSRRPLDIDSGGAISFEGEICEICVICGYAFICEITKSP